MTRFRALTVIALTIGLVITGIVWAQGPRSGGLGRGPRGLFGGGPQLPLGALNLTVTQQEQVRAVRERYSDETWQALERLRQALEVQREAVEALPIDESLILSTSQGLAEAQTAVAIQQARIRSEVWAVLTPEQQQQAQALGAERQTRMQRFRERMQERRDQRRGRHPRAR